MYFRLIMIHIYIIKHKALIHVRYFHCVNNWLHPLSVRSANGHRSSNTQEGMQHCGIIHSTSGKANIETLATQVAQHRAVYRKMHFLVYTQARILTSSRGQVQTCVDLMRCSPSNTDSCLMCSPSSLQVKPSLVFSSEDGVDRGV